MKKLGYKDIFCQKEYLKMIIAALINRFGDSVDAIASTWIVYELTQNAAWSTIIYALNRIPTVIVTPFAGAYVEGRNKKRIMIATDIIRAVCVSVVATGYWKGFLTPWILVVTTIVISTAEAFRGPANTALTPKILDKEYYDYGMSLMNTMSTIVELIGTAMAAGIIAVIGTAGAIYLDMITFLLSAVVIAFVNTKELEIKKKRFEQKEYLNTLLDGLAYARKEKTVLFFCGIAVFANGILVPFNSLQAPLTEEILHGGAEVLSILGIALTTGMLLGSVSYPVLRKFLSAKRAVALGIGGIGVYYLMLILGTPLYVNKWIMYVSIALTSVLFGFFVTLFNSFVNVEFVKQIDEAYLARVSAVMSALCCAATPIVAFVISGIAAFVKTEWLFIIAGMLTLAILPLFLRSDALDERKKEQLASTSDVVLME